MQVTDEIWDCRVECGSNTYRLLCFWGGRNRLILTHGFQKKIRKTPGKEIERAERYRKNYFGGSNQ
ncbi:type II toxin-antitoxin system RelE/ParE family toxin [Leptospira wolffii]|uniref:type II toxin-antitoxin system RelE/ParE family toxin n=1 Tax=Leptospira wolffii TaxID=409998 RepID=UPI001AEF54AE|nr:type II toxin-antitoxin system RelE/ParE family toxin [Leptospira wolffii]